MNDQNFLTFTIESDLNEKLNESNVPRMAVIFYSGDRWRYQLREELLNGQNRSETEKLLKESNANLSLARGPLDFVKVNIKIEWFEKDHKYLYKITSINDILSQNEYLQGTRTSIKAIPFFNESMLDAAKISDGATHYCWLNCVNIEGNTIAKNAKVDEISMLLLGGLAYFKRTELDNDYELIYINRFRQSDNGCLICQNDKPWKSEYTQALDDQDRFMNVKYAAFLDANESFVSSIDPKRKWTPTQNWAFLYLFNDDKSPNEKDRFFEILPDPLGRPVSETSHENN
ncbi:unnamed protein product [Adineta ricciae]|uniref:Uncharacterized protein n=1 Tax=Adineta ricciae TaxID=249248 RepID=A0A816F6P4_ADIRI|nr:unnamed protein product [Adineta ricciae]